MKFLFIIVIIISVLAGCTLSKDELLQDQEVSNFKLSLDFNIAGDTAHNFYYIIVLNDTADLYHQSPLSKGINHEVVIPNDSSKQGYWFILKRWITNDSVYESSPFYLSFKIPKNALSMHLVLHTKVNITKRKTFYEFDNVSFNILEPTDIYGNNVPWDKNNLDDGVSGPLPDIYLIFENYFSTRLIDYIDQPLGHFLYNLNNKKFPASITVLSLSCWDYDFNVSPDDMIFSTSFYLNSITNQQSYTSNGISKIIILYGTNTIASHDPSAILTVKIY